MTAPTPLLSIDVGKVAAQTEVVYSKLGETGKRLQDALGQSIFEFSSDMVADAQQAAAVRTGNLRGAATVEDPVFSDTGVTCKSGFNIKYGRQRDQGGDIVPTKSGALAIPLSPIMTGAGVSRYSSPREETDLFVLKTPSGKTFLATRGALKGAIRQVELHWMLVSRVTQKGDGFFSKVVEARKVDAAPVIAGRMAQIMGELS